MFLLPNISQKKNRLIQADPQDVSNSRPISLLSALSKDLERILHKCMFNFYRDLDFLSPFQSGLCQIIPQSTN